MKVPPLPEPVKRGRPGLDAVPADLSEGSFMVGLCKSRAIRSASPPVGDAR